MTDEQTGFRPWPDSDSEADFAPEPAAPPWWRRALGLLRGSSARRQARLRELDDAIALSPDAAANYTLRGELRLEMGEPELARYDFERALALAGPQVEGSRWGIVEQALVDRARRGLAKAERLAPPPPDTSMVDAPGERLTDDIPSSTGA